MRVPAAGRMASHAAGLTGVLAAAAVLRHAAGPPVVNLGLLNPYVSAALLEWRKAAAPRAPNLVAAVPRQAAALPLTDRTTPVAGQLLDTSLMLTRIVTAAHFCGPPRDDTCATAAVHVEHQILSACWLCPVAALL